MTVMADYGCKYSSMYSYTCRNCIIAFVIFCCINLVQAGWIDPDTPITAQTTSSLDNDIHRKISNDYE